MEPSTTTNENAPHTAPWVSRALVLGFVVWIVGFGAVALFRSLNQSGAEVTVESPFKPWEGVWSGELVTLDADGKEVKRVRVRQTYRHVLADKDFRQEVHIEVTDPATGKTELDRTLNSADFKGAWMKRKTIRANGHETIKYVGRIENGAVIWNRSLPGIEETFREWIEGDVSRVEGTGVYSGEKPETLKFVGEFRRVIVEK